MTIRPARLEDGPALARVHVDAWLQTYTGLVPQSYLDSLSYAAREERWQRILTTPRPDEINFVAEDRGQVVGFASGGKEREGDSEFLGELYALYLLKSHQGQGTGRQLFGAVVAHLRERGYPSMMLWVLAGNPAERFYQHLGGVKVREQELELAGVKLPEWGYGWHDLGGLP